MVNWVFCFFGIFLVEFIVVGVCSDGIEIDGIVYDGR